MEMNPEDKAAIERISELEDELKEVYTLLDLAQADLEDRDLRIAHLVGELSKTKVDPTYEAQISVA
jgi:hypothetical protein